MARQYNTSIEQRKVMFNFKLIFSGFVALVLISVCLEAGNLNWTEDQQKIAELFRKYGHHIDHPGYPENHEYWDQIRWYHGQGDKVRPVLIFLLENDYKKDFEKMFNVLAGLKNSPGDKSDVVNYIRENLPGSFGRQEDHEANGCIEISLRILGEYGMPDDINIINDFKDNSNAMVQRAAKDALDHMGKRIEAGTFRRKSVEEEGRTPLEPSVVSEPRSSKSSEADDPKESPSKWAVLASLAILLASIGVWIKRRISAQKNSNK